MRWILMVQDVLPTALQSITTKAEQFLKKWWHLPRPASRDALRLVTGIPSISDIADQAQCTKYSIASASSDPSVSNILEVRKNAKYKPVARLLRSLGGSIPNNKRKAMKILKEHQLQELKTRVGKLVVQGAWLQLGKTLQTDTQWRCIMWSLPASVQQFACKAAIDVLPTRANLLRWKTGCDSACSNCGVKETLHHILNNCQRLLNSGAYKWRHDSILHQIAPQLQSIHPTAQVTVDLPDSTYKLPFICDTDWRPDIIISRQNHKIEFVELTVPFESNWKAAHTRKTDKYAALLTSAKENGFVATLTCIEMGSRGLPSSDWENWISQNKLSKNLTKTCSSIAISASHVIWLHKSTTWPNPPPMTDQRHTAN